jgi:hypothetical protein
MSERIENKINEAWHQTASETNVSVAYMTFNTLKSKQNTIFYIQLNIALVVVTQKTNLTFMGPCIVNIFQYISNKMQRYTVYLYLANCSTCFEWYLHPSSGAHTTLSAACGICHTWWWVEVPPETCRAVSRYK